MFDDRIQINGVSLEKIEDDIMVSKYHEGVKLTKKMAEDIDNLQLQLSRGKDQFIIADFSEGNVELDKEAEAYFLKDSKMIPYINAVAIISDPSKFGPVKKFFTRKHAFYPIKEVKSKEEAKVWFESIKDDVESALL